MQKHKNQFRNGGKRPLLPALFGILAIGSLVYASIALNREPDLSIELPKLPSETPGAGQFAELPLTITPGPLPGTLPTPAAGLPGRPGQTTGRPTAAPTQAPTKAPAAPTKGASLPAPTAAGLPVSGPSGLAALRYDGTATLHWPVYGEVILPFSTEHTVYYKTLDTFRTSNGVLLAGNIGDAVIAAADGIVTEITTDDYHGQLITLALGGDYEITYGQLTPEALQVGDAVKAGDVLGRIAEPTRYFSLEGPHAYVALTRGEEPVNPLLYFSTPEE